MTAAELEDATRGEMATSSAALKLEPAHASSNAQSSLRRLPANTALLALSEGWLAGMADSSVSCPLCIPTSGPPSAHAGNMHPVDSSRGGDKDVKGK